MIVTRGEGVTKGVYTSACGRNDDGKAVYGGTKSPVSVSDEKVQANQDRV